MLLLFFVDPRNLPLKAGQNRVINRQDHVVVVVLVVVVVDFVGLFNGNK